MDIQTIKKFLQDKSELSKPFLYTTEKNIIIQNLPAVLVTSNDILPPDISIDATLFTNVISRLNSYKIDVDNKHIIIEANKSIIKIPILNNNKQDIDLNMQTQNIPIINGLFSLMGYARKFKVTYPDYGDKIFIKNGFMFYTNGFVAIFKKIEYDLNLVLPVYGFLSSLDTTNSSIEISVDNRFIIFTTTDAKVIIPVSVDVFEITDKIIEFLSGVDSTSVIQIDDDIKQFIDSFAYFSDIINFRVENDNMVLSIIGDELNASTVLSKNYSIKEDIDISFDSKKFSSLLRMADKLSLQDRIAVFTNSDLIMVLSYIRK